MKPPVILVGGVFALALVVLAGRELLSLGDDRAEAEDFDNEDPREGPQLPRVLPPGVSLDSRVRSTPGKGVTPEFVAGGGTPGNEAVTAAEAEASYGNALAELDQILIDRKRLSEEEFEEINRWANDAFTGYQIHLDGNEPGDRDQLDAAHRQLVTRLGKLKKRVRKKRRRR